jgi:CPA2 family monovalent cation:H+ antiporter-2
MLLGVPLNRVVKRIRDTREHRYSLLRGFFHGASDAAEDVAHKDMKLLHSVLIVPGAAAVGKTLGETGIERLGIEIKAERRHGVHTQEPNPEARFRAGDVIVLFGTEQDCAAAEMKLMQG